MKLNIAEASLARLVHTALREDIGAGDSTTIACIPKSERGNGAFVSKAAGVLCGMDIVARVFHAVDPSTTITTLIHDGSLIKKDSVIAEVHGSMQSLLTAERTALNFLQHLSAIATKTNSFVEAVRGTQAVILDTRKTTPLLRALEKYAVRCGGGSNHRFGLDDMMLIKDNHIAAAGSITDAVARCIEHRKNKKMLIEVETTSVHQVKEILSINGIDRIMLDNYSLPEIRKAVKLVAHRVPLEVSGGVSLENIRAIAETGVEFISVGAITHSAPAIDISFQIE